MSWMEAGQYVALAVLAYYAGYLHGTAEGRHRQKWNLPINRWLG